MKRPTIPTILYVDDDSDDCFFLSESLEGTPADLICASNGEEAIQFLQSLEDPGALPSLIILDMNMPRWNGRQTLGYLKSQPELASIPVVILSTSDTIEEQEACAQLGAASYKRKPFHFDGYRQIMNEWMPLIARSAATATRD